MSGPDALVRAASGFIDLATLPFTLPGSRILVREAAGGGLSVCRAEYEVDAADAVAVPGLQLLGDAGTPLPVTGVAVDRIDFGGGVASLTFGAPDELSIGGAGVAALRLAPHGPSIALDGSDARLIVAADRSVRVERDRGHAERLARTATLWRDWFCRCPRVRADLVATAAHCWWVLGANQVELGLVPGSRAVVPSKLGYVALWQWDAYFIAIGLRHGDLALAQEQLELALGFACSDGQLPDVIHDTGVLASSDDLPPADLARLRELGSPAADASVPVAMTKPPLAALALTRLADSGASREWLARMLPAVQDSQDWWFGHSLAGDGLPEYGHPYSSGLDDSPAFDADLPVATPDLVAYLELQDLLLADLLATQGDPDAEGHRARAASTRQLLLRLWDPDRRRFAPRGSHGPVAAHTVVDLLPLLAGTLSDDVVAALADDLADPATFAAPFPVPTVAQDDPDFDPARMWRGPTWLSTNWLLVEGLQRSGREDAAHALAGHTLAMVAEAGGAFEYYHPLTGHRPARAVTAFAWTAALFLDLAVRFAPGEGLDPPSAP